MKISLFWFTIIYFITNQFNTLFSFHAFFSNIYPKINIQQILGLAYTISIASDFVYFFMQEIVFLFFSTDFYLLMYHTNVKNIEQVQLAENLPPFYLPYQFFFCV